MSKTQPIHHWGILSCPPKVSIEERGLLSMDQAQRIEVLFKTLANSTRLRLLHALIRNSEMRVTEIAEAIAMKPQAVSNQLQRLADRGILGSRRDGTQILYHILDPCVVTILEYGLCLSEDAQWGNKRVGKRNN
jgi:ArsR family transcriptional regulator, lead/cadmium/zinc/bismuth-responsive transcriptional repressor